MNHKLSVDLLKIMMALCVVTIHINPLRGLPDQGVFLTGGIARTAVPVFFLINGYFSETIARNGGIRTYVIRVLWLYAIWSLIYVPAWSWDLFHPDALRLVRFIGMGWWHLWYLPGLALAAALGGLMQNWALSRQVAVIAISFLTGVGIVYALVFDVLHVSKQVFGDATILHRNGLFLGLPFLMAGMLIRRYGLEQRFSLPVLAVICGVSLALVVGEGMWLRAAKTGVLHLDNSLFLGLASPVLFLFALKFTAETRSKTYGVYANGLYFIHVAFVVAGLRLTDWPWPMVFVIAVAGSLAITWGMIRSGWDRRLL